MKLTRLAILITLTYSALPALATEFNAGLLNAADDNNIDLSAFSRDGYIAPGNYLLDIWLNDQSVSALPAQSKTSTTKTPSWSHPDSHTSAPAG
ncbi:hypothetical protein KHS55_001920 [Salmonella enterica subsp. enterica serovar Arechavaleta]|nr:hypothetical protein [Salmonella enterica subsp. enterica serovar Arechavaleta]EHN1350972.1 hypothetical protein [Salmonella enterica subsp. enterica serovar Arechavaleta]EIZ6733238.1 hypothetical protein [Salmonella enterica subsp. enterica serovar Arechavaleta]